MIPALRIRTFGLSVALLLAISIFLGFLSFNVMTTNADKTTEQWEEFETIALQKTELLSQLRSQIGFDGVLHHLNNYLLSPERRYLVKIHQKLQHLNVIITTYNGLPSSPDERAALMKIHKTLQEFRETLEVAEQLFYQGYDASDINQIFRNDDDRLISAVRILDSQITAYYQDNLNSLQQSIYDGATTTRIIGIVMISLLCVMSVFITWYLFSRLIAPMEGLINRVKFADHGQTELLNLEVHQNLADTELGQLTETFNDYSKAVEKQNQSRRQAQEELHNIFENAVDGIIIINDHGIIQTFNKAASEIFGYKPYEIVGRNVSCLMPDPDRSNHDQYLENYITTRDPKIIGTGRDVTGLRKDGTLFPMRLAVSQSLSPSGLVFTGLVKDLTAEKAIEESLRKAKVDAEHANRAKSEFLSSMSHELRTPLNAIIGFAQLLGMSKRESLSPRQQKQVKQIETGGQHLLDLINQILDLARIEAGKLSLSIERVNARDVIDECLALSEPQAKKHHVNVIDESDLGLPDLKIDRLRFKQALLNLLSNAIKYNHPNGKVILNTSCSQDSLTLKVTDTGIGIHPDKLTLLFQPFNRLGAENTEVEGTGIGLVITKHLVQEMNGNLEVESEINHGSCFAITVPIAHEEDRPIQLTSGQTTGEISARKDGINILYVEDNPANMTLMEDFLHEIDGYHLMGAYNAEIGLTIAAEVKPDVIILDINLPGMDGVDAIRKLRKMKAGQNIPIIALSADAMPGSIKRAMEAGFDHYLTKPADLTALMEILSKVEKQPH